MFERLMNVLKSMFNSGVSKMETPEILAEQAEMELKKSVKEVQEALTSSMTNEKMLDQQIKKTAEERASWEKRAAIAVGQNNDEVARQCLQKKVELVKQEETLAQQLEEQKKQTVALRERFTKMDQENRDFGLKKASMTARAKSSDALAKANELLSDNSGSSMNKWEDRIRASEMRNAAIAEMNGQSAALEEVKKLEKNSQLDDELAALKANLAAGGGAGAKGAPKLIVQNTEEAEDVEVVAESEPMLIEKKGD